MVKRTNDERHADHDREVKVLTEIMLTRTAAEWEVWLQERHVPACRVRTMGEALADPQIASRDILHKHENAPGVPGRSPFRSPRSNSPMAARRSTARRRCSASTTRKC